MEEQKTALSNQIEIADKKAQYDAEAKRILSNKIILSWILQKTTEEFKNVPLEKIQDAIEGTPEISNDPVYPGKKPQIITGFSNEDKVPNEGEIRYDIKFFVITPDKNRIKLIINVEAQKSYNTGYDLVTRAIYYCSRMLSSQIDTEFTIPDYDGIKKVYSIWICMQAPKYAQNTITAYNIQPKDIFGHYTGKARYDLLSAIMVRIGDDDNDLNSNSLTSMLSVLLSKDKKPAEKEKCLSEKFGINPSIEMKEGLNIMCNLSYGIAEEAEIKGRAEGRAEGREKIVLQCLQSGKTCEQIAAFIGISLDEVKAVEKKAASRSHITIL